MRVTTQAFVLVAAVSLMLPSASVGQKRSDRQDAFNACVIGALPKFDDGVAAPESIFLAARLHCNREEDALTQSLTAEFERRFADADPKLKMEYVFTLRDAVMEKTLQGVAGIVLMQRVANRNRRP